MKDFIHDLNPTGVITKIKDAYVNAWKRRNKGKKEEEDAQRQAGDALRRGVGIEDDIAKIKGMYGKVSR